MRRQQERRLRQVRPRCEALHRIRVRAVGVEDDGHRIAAEGLLGEDIDLVEAPHRSRGVEYDEREGRGGRSRVDVSVGPGRIEPGAVAGMHLDAVVADVERDGARLDAEQLERSGAVRFACALIAGCERPGPEFERPVADE